MDAEQRYANVFRVAVREWWDTTTGDEKGLVKTLSEKINGEEGMSFTSVHEAFIPECEVFRRAFMDMVFVPEEIGRGATQSPLVIFEFGLNGDEWWKKFDQGVQYVERLCSTSSDGNCQYCLEQPALLVVVTIDKATMDKESGKIVVKMGILLATPRTPTKDTNGATSGKNDFRLSILWQAETNTLKDGSQRFGRLLRVASDFQHWRTIEVTPPFKYFSSNCCKVGDVREVGTPLHISLLVRKRLFDSLSVRFLYNHLQVVLRSFDSRFRRTSRSATIYLDERCQDIVGGQVHTVVQKFANKFWSEDVDDGSLLIIETPYRPGGHVANSPKAFLPIINALQDLHERGYVHGDIRAFNTVFGANETTGCLIDFDLGGQADKAVYPVGYVFALDDGFRKGKVGEKIGMKGDWFALGNLIFHTHIWAPTERADLYKEYAVMISKWPSMSQAPSPEEIKELQTFLERIQGWTVAPKFEEIGAVVNRTSPNASGTPLKKP
jgi:hypothetical protein